MKKTIQLFCLLLLVLVLSVAPSVGLYFAKSNTTKKALFGDQADETMVLVVWNVDTFEGGSMSKVAILERVSRDFEKQHKGLFVIVKNMSKEQFANQIKTERPDVISFGSGMYDLVKEYSLGGQIEPCVLENVRQSVTQDEETLATPWALGAYFVFATEESLSRAGAPTENIVKNCQNFAFDKTIGKKTKHTYSLALGTDVLHSSKDALSDQIQFNSTAAIQNWEQMSYYDAYVQFVGGNATYLLGTQRDVCRLENKQSQGSISGLVAEMLKSTDLVQYAVATVGKSEIRTKYAKLFCKFLTSTKAQSQVFAGGLLPVIALAEDKNQNGILRCGMTTRLSIKKLY